MKMKIHPRFKFMTFRRHNRQLSMVEGELKNSYEVILNHVHNHSHEEIKELVLEVREAYPNYHYQHELALAERKIKKLELKVKLLQLQIRLLEQGSNDLGGMSMCL